MKQVLIAQQSTIAHYRIPFFNALEQVKPLSWRFDVVFDANESKRTRFFKENLDLDVFKFHTLNTNTLILPVGKKAISYQTFWQKAGKYDLIIVENAVNNLTYPLCHLHKFHHKKIAYWGHGKDRSIVKMSPQKYLAEKFKLFLVKNADGFFAYTPGVKQYLEQQGLSSQKIFVVNNSIDILIQRQAYQQWYPQRLKIRNELGLADKKVLLYVGRFTHYRKFDFLLEAFSSLRQLDHTFHLMIVGDGGETFMKDAPPDISYLGPIVALDKLAPIFVASDLYVFPGSVGLGPLQALCYDLPVITIQSDNHGPEIEYLTAQNSFILDEHTSPHLYAESIHHLFQHPEQLTGLKKTVWNSIKHLTIEQMANHFALGISTLLETP